MTSIASSSIQSAVIAPEASAVAQDHKPSATAKAATEVPATIVSISPKAIAKPLASYDDLPTLDPNKVSNALAQVSGANGLAFLDAHLDLSLYTARFGEAAATGLKQGIYETEYTFAGVSSASATDAGVAVHSSIKNPNDLKSYVASGSSAPVIGVADFSFKSAGSVYSVTNQPDGTLLGTKDGQAWQTWQLTAVNGNTNFGNSSSDAATALQTLTSLNDHEASSKALAPLDISA